MRFLLFAEDFGIQPNTGADCTECLTRLLETRGHDAEIRFQPGIYRFAADHASRRSYAISNSDPAPAQSVSILLEGCRNLTLDFGGSTLLFRGQTIALGLDRCENVTILNASVDWDVPFSAEGEILTAGPGEITVAIDPMRYPYEVQDGQLLFKGPGWQGSALFGAMEFGRETRRVRPGAGDTFPRVTALPGPSGQVRLRGQFSPVPQPGNLLVLRHGKRVHPGLFCQNSSGIRLENVTFFSTCGLGALFQFSQDISVRRTAFLPNRDRGRRVLSGHDDGLHFSNCRGGISITECRFAGLMDDAVNIHGTSARILSLQGRVVRGQFCHPQSVGFSQWAKAGDTVSFLDRCTMDSLGSLTVTAFRPETPETFLLALSGPVPAGAQPGDALENLSNTPSVRCCRNFFGSGRARGMLVTTPKPVYIADNRFESSGSALLLSGDANGWYESGACRDVEICRNLFTRHCLTSQYQFCEGVISLCPEIPDMARSHGFHRDVRIHDNVFYDHGVTLLYAHCAKNVEFQNNVIRRPPDAAPVPYVRQRFCTLTEEGNHTSIL